MKTLKTLAVSVALTSVAGAAWAQMNHGSHDQNGAPTMDQMQSMMLPASGDSASTEAFKRADMEMMHGMAVQYSGDADVDFHLKMIPHHQGAIDMAKVVLEHGTDPDTRTLAKAIIATQEREIAAMRAWLEKKGK